MLSKPYVTSPIVGFTSPKHVEEAVAALDITLTPEEIAALEAPYVLRYLYEHSGIQTRFPSVLC